MPNSVPGIKEKMMEEIGIKSIDDLYVDIPEAMRFKGDLDIPGPFTEAEVREEVSGTLERNWGLRCPPLLGGGVRTTCSSACVSFIFWLPVFTRMLLSIDIQIMFFKMGI